MSGALDLLPRSKPSRHEDDLRLIGRSGNLTAWAFGAVEAPKLFEARRFADPRGIFAETYSRRDFAALGLAEEFVQDNWSLSERVGTVRGLHFQRRPHAQAKLVRVLRGRILDRWRWTSALTRDLRASTSRWNCGGRRPDALGAGGLPRTASARSNP
jgi:hypothetical protein